MGCMWNTTPPQPEAWWMKDPSMNWNDGSLRNVVLSLPKPTTQVGHYLFLRSELDPLPSAYPSVSGIDAWMGLPVSDLDSLSDVPAHTAILYDWVQSGSDPNIVEGAYF